MSLTGIQLDEPLIPGSAEWLATYSASQVAAICNLCPPNWGTERSVYDAKKRIVPQQEQSDAMAGGHYWEPHIRQWFADANPDRIVAVTGTWRHAIRDWQTANPDALVDDELLEIKTTHDLREWNGQVPIYYRAQAQWQMDVTGARRTHFAVCGPFELFNRKPRMFVVDYDARDAAALRERVLEFDAALQAGIQPPANHDSEADRLAVRYANPTIVDDPGVEIPDDLAALYLEPYIDRAATEARARSGASQLLEYLGESRKATYRGTTIATRIPGRGEKPPTLRATNGLADKAADLLRKDVFA